VLLYLVIVPSSSDSVKFHITWKRGCKIYIHCFARHTYPQTGIDSVHITETYSYVYCLRVETYISYFTNEMAVMHEDATRITYAISFNVSTVHIATLMMRRSVLYFCHLAYFLPSLFLSGPSSFPLVS
jgi:hypothetical protein